MKLTAIIQISEDKIPKGYQVQDRGAQINSYMSLKFWKQRVFLTGTKNIDPINIDTLNLYHSCTDYITDAYVLMGKYYTNIPWLLLKTWFTMLLMQQWQLKVMHMIPSTHQSRHAHCFLCAQQHYTWTSCTIHKHSKSSSNISKLCF